MILNHQEILTAGEVKEVLNLSNDEFDYLIGQGLPFIEIKGKKLFLTGSIKIFFGRNEQWTRKGVE